MAMRTAAIALVIIFVLSGTCLGEQPGRLVTSTELADPRLRLPMSGDAWLQQTATVRLAAGPNAMAFAFGALEIPLDKLELDITDPAGAVEITDTAIAPEDGGSILWQLSAAQNCAATMEIGFPLKGIEWRCEYDLSLPIDPAKVDINAWAVITNRSKLEFPWAQLTLPGGHPLSAQLIQNETVKLPLFSATGLACAPAFVYDPAKYKGDVTAVLRLLRDGQDVFSARGVPAGKLTIHSPGPPTTYLGEDTLPYLAPSERVDVRLGIVPEVTVARKVVKSTQVEPKTDVRNKLVLFHQDDEIEFEIKNMRKTALRLEVKDRIPGDWKMVKHSDPFEREDGETIRFDLEVGPGATRKVTYTARRMNLEP